MFASTWLLRSKFQLRQVLDATLRASSTRNPALLYALSNDAPELDDILGQICDSTPETVGCITSPLPFKRGSTRSVEGLFSLALAVVERESCTPFALENTGEGPVQVGRWHTFRKKNVKDSGVSQLLEENTDWNEVWKGNRHLPTLPPELQNLKCVWCSLRECCELTIAVN